jgi:hypothetical protein
MDEPTIQIWPHYETQATIKSIDDLKKLFPDGKADELNWCVFSTSGVHGSYQALDDIEKYLFNNNDDYSDSLTVLVIHPRLVVLKYGVIKINKQDISWLRKLVKSTLKAVEKSQKGNL